MKEMNHLNRMQFFTTSMGNTLEWLDFGLFIFMAPLIGSTFFPAESTTMATLDALMVFAAGFICRPLGGVFFGHFGDTTGRVKTLRYSILVIMFSTLSVGLLPSYQQVGPLAPLLFILIRLIQGLSIGGEYSGVMIYLAETAPPHRRGFITSFAATGANVGFLAATLLYLLLIHVFSKQAIADWAWRLPFIFAGLPGSLIIYYRFKLTETPVYSHIKTTRHVQTKPFISVIKQAPMQLLKIIGLTCMGSTFYYVFFGFMPTYLQRYRHFPLQDALTIQSVFLVAMLFLVPLAGLCGDYFSRKRMLLCTASGMVLAAIPCFYLLQTSEVSWVILSIGIAAFLSSLDQGNTPIAVVENCPENVRYSGIAFAYNLGVALFGGTSPFVVTVLTEKVGLIAPAYYLVVMAGISLCAASTLLNQNKQFGMLRS